jgi:hypothetical protein
MDRNQEYIRQLQERNRIKKMMTEKTEDDMIKEELERGFSTHFRGAHASKDTSTSSKTAAVKPHVKVHTKAPPNDLLQRLMPPGLNQGTDLSPDQYRASSRGPADPGRGFDQPLSTNRSNISRDGSSSSRRNADRSRSGSRHQGQINTESGTEILLKEDIRQFGEEECEQVLEPKSTLSIESPCRSSRQNSRPHLSAGSTAPVMDLMQSSDLNELLLGHIKGLSAEQKIAMIQLLQHTNAPSSTQEQPKVTMEPHVVESHRYFNAQKTSSHDFRDDAVEQEHSTDVMNPDQPLVNTTSQHVLDARGDLSCHFV